MNPTESIAFASACKQFFGVRPGNTLLQFAQELKALTPQDKVEMAPLLGVALSKNVTLA